MKIKLRNIGKIENAVVEIDGITVIAGENNTGKSTVSKALYAMFNSFFQIQKQIRKFRFDSIYNVIMLLYFQNKNRDIPIFEFEKMVSSFLNEKTEEAVVRKQLESLPFSKEVITAETVRDSASRICEILNV